MRHARTPRPKRHGLDAVVAIIVVILLTISASALIVGLSLWYIATHQ